MYLIQPQTHKIVPGLNESVTEYELSFRSNIVTESAQSSTDCAEETCAYSFIPWSSNGSSYHVTVAARNAVTLGQQQTCRVTPLVFDLGRISSCIISMSRISETEIVYYDSMHGKL